MFLEAGGPSHWDSIYTMVVCPLKEQEAVYKSVGMDKTNEADAVLIPICWKLSLCLIPIQRF